MNDRLSHFFLSCAVVLIQLLRNVMGDDGIGRGKQVEGDPRVGHPVGGIDTRAKVVADGSAVQRPAVDLGHPEQGPQSASLGDAKSLQSLGHEGTVLILQRHNVGDGSEGGQIEQWLICLRRLQKGLSDFVGDACAGELFPRIPAVQPGGADDQGAR